MNSKCGVQSKRRCESHESCVCIVGFPSCGCQKKNVVYETECIDMQQFREVSRTRTIYSTETHTSDLLQCRGHRNEGRPQQLPSGFRRSSDPEPSGQWADDVLHAASGEWRGAGVHLKHPRRSVTSRGEQGIAQWLVRRSLD